MYELHAACAQGNLLLVKKLLKAGHKIDQLDKAGTTPICHAAEAGQLDVIKYLIERKANLSAQSTSNLSSNLLYRVSRCNNVAKQKIILEWLFNHFDKLSFNDGTQKHHFKLALDLHINPDNPRLTNTKYNDRLSNWIRAIFYLSTDTVNASNNIDKLKHYLKLSNKYFELMPNKSDLELRGYQICIQSMIIATSPEISEHTLELALKMTHAGRRIKDPNETDLTRLALNYQNTAEMYRVLRQFENAKNSYLRAFQIFPLLGINSESALSNAPSIFKCLAECYNNPYADIFFGLISDCFEPDKKVNRRLMDFLNLILNFVNEDICELAKPAAIFIDNLIHFYDLSIFPNQQLAGFLSDNNNYNKLLEIRHLLLLKQMNCAFSRNKYTFFAGQALPTDTMEDNLPPTSLTEPHAFQSSL